MSAQADYADAITKQLTERLLPTKLQVLDESADHAGHVGANADGFGTHVRVRIASPVFAGKTRVAVTETNSEGEEGQDTDFSSESLGDESTALSTSIEDLNLTARTTNALINNDIHTIRDLFALNDAELRDLKGFGSKALDEVKEKLAELEL